MKAIHYDAEGDILSVTFAEAKGQNQTGVELTDNIVLYLNPQTEQPLSLILSSYQAMMRANEQTPLRLEGLAEVPSPLRTIIMNLLQHAPLNGFLQLVEPSTQTPPTSRLHEIFSPAVLQAI